MRKKLEKHRVTKHLSTSATVNGFIVAQQECSPAARASPRHQGRPQCALLSKTAGGSATGCFFEIKGSESEQFAGTAGIQLAQAVGGILDLGGEDHCGDDIRFVGGFEVKRIDVAFKDTAVHFAFLAGETGDIGRQAVHVKRIAVFGLFHLRCRPSLYVRRSA